MNTTDQISQQNEKTIQILKDRAESNHKIIFVGTAVQIGNPIMEKYQERIKEFLALNNF